MHPLSSRPPVAKSEFILTLKLQCIPGWILNQVQDDKWRKVKKKRQPLPVASENYKKVNFIVVMFLQIAGVSYLQLHGQEVQHLLLQPLNFWLVLGQPSRQREL